ncbi:MAG: hypothetical protein M1476_03835 [Candidatus Thermoplasmatota archaeon]|nr:hypothetical protein [Candidatus Thermoplasmatota archaeon]
MVVAYPSFLQPYSAEVTLLLIFLDGLMLGFAVKKAFTAVVLTFVGLVIAYFLGLTFVPNVSISSIVHAIEIYATTIHFGSLIISFSIMVFIIGFGIGMWRG